MPTNLPPEAQAAYSRHMDATTLEEKIRTLEEFLSLVPKHKGTEKLIALHRSRLVKLRRELEKRKAAKKGSGAPTPFSIQKSGDIEAVLVGTNGVGKTSLLNALANTKHPVGVSTHIPIQGVTTCCKGVLLQIVEAPALFEGASRGIGNGRQILGLIRNSDIIGLVIDLTSDIKWQISVIIKELENASLRINVTPPPVVVERTGSGGILIFGAENYDIDTTELKEYLREAGFRNCALRILGPVSMRQIIDSLDNRIRYMRALIIATKGDLSGTAESFDELIKLAGNKFKVIPVSLVKKKGLTELKESFFTELDLIRVWTKSEKGIGERPLVLKRNSTVRDAAKKIHSSFVEHFRYAVIHRSSDKSSMKKVGINYKLEDGDIIQIVTSIWF